MSGQNFYFVTALPPLGDLGSPAPMTPQQLLQHVSESSAAEVVAALLLHDDLLQREALQAEEGDDAVPAVLTAEQVRDEQPLPEYLAPRAGESGPRTVAVDVTWEAYFRYAADVARRGGNELLAGWVGFEVALRNALVQRRAKALGIDAAAYVVAADLADESLDFTAVLNEWASAANPLAGLQVLDRSRWNWLNDHQQWFSFSDDELAAYAAKLMLLSRWQRLAAARDEHAAGNAAANP